MLKELSVRWQMAFASVAVVFAVASPLLGVHTAVAAPAATGVQYMAAAAQSAQPISEQAKTRFKSSWTWYVTRASGLAAALLLALLMVSGIGQVTGFTYRYFEPLTAWAVHRAMGIALLWSVGLHMTVLLMDKFVPFKLADLFVPFLSTNKAYANQGQWKLGVGLGVLSMYATVIVVASSLLWINKRVHSWRLVHYVSYALMAAVFVHALFIGTDIKRGVVRFAWIIAGVLIVGAVFARLLRARTISGGKK